MPFEGGNYPHKYPAIRIESDISEEETVPASVGYRAVSPTHEEDREDTDMTRRTLLKGTGLIAASGIATHYGLKYIHEHVNTDTLTHEERIDNLPTVTKKIKAETVEKFPFERECITRDLEGVRIGGLAAKYFDWPPQLPLPAKFARRFDVTQRKLNAEKNIRHPNERNKIVGEYLEALYKQCLANGKEAPTTLAQTIINADRETREVGQKLDWNKVQHIYNLSREGLAVLHELSSQITGESLASYSMTEILSSGKGAAVDVKAMDLLYRSAGEAFVTLATPALFDAKTSFGKYQFTDLAIYKGPNTRMPRNKNGAYPIEHRGASKMNQALPENEQLPNDVIGLTTMKLQDRAAYLFALNNIAEAIHQIAPGVPAPKQHVALHRGGPRVVNSREITVRETNALKDKSSYLLSQLLRMPHSALLEYISASHHKPNPTRTSLVQYLHTDLSTSFKDHCANDLEAYAHHTDINHAELLVELATLTSRNPQQAVG